MTVKENPFRKDAEILLMKGRINTPIIGIKMIRNRINSLFILGLFNQQKTRGRMLWRILLKTNLQNQRLFPGEAKPYPHLAFTGKTQTSPKIISPILAKSRGKIAL
jgi:hypothetical protein